MATETLIDIEVAWATPQVQQIVVMQIPPGMTARAIVLKADADAAISTAGIDAGSAPLGIFGREITDDYCPVQGDRIELYRPLVRNPREARRLRASAGTD